MITWSVKEGNDNGIGEIGRFEGEKLQVVEGEKS